MSVISSSPVNIGSKTRKEVCARTGRVVMGNSISLCSGMDSDEESGEALLAQHE